MYAPCPAWSSTPLNTLVQPWNTTPAINGEWQRLTNSIETEISEWFKENWDWEDYFLSVARRSRARRHMLPPLPGTFHTVWGDIEDFPTLPVPFHTVWGDTEDFPSWSQPKAFTGEGEALMPPPSCSLPCISDIHGLYNTDLITEIMLYFLQFFPSQSLPPTLSFHSFSLLSRTPYLLP